MTRFFRRFFFGIPCGIMWRRRRLRAARRKMARERTTLRRMKQSLRDMEVAADNREAEIWRIRTECGRVVLENRRIDKWIHDTLDEIAKDPSMTEALQRIQAEELRRNNTENPRNQSSNGRRRRRRRP